MEDIDVRNSVLNAIKNLCYERKEFTLASGRKSDFYIDLRRISFDGNYLYLIGLLLYRRITEGKGFDFSVIAGVPVGGIPLTSAILAASYIDANPLKSVVIRKERKEYGKGRLIEPVQFLSPGSKILIVEDVVTTGGSVLKAANNAISEGYKVTDTICMVDRLEGGAEFLMGNGIKLHPLFTRNDIVNEQV